MSRELVMPKLGLTMEEGTIIKWFKNEGDKVMAGDKLFEVETDKLTNEITADTEGILKKILVKERESVAVKTLVGIIASENEEVSSMLSDNIKLLQEHETGISYSRNVAEEEVVLENNSEYILATPFAKKLANEENINLAKIIPHNGNKVIYSKDVENYKKQEMEATKVRITPTAKKIAEEYNIDVTEIKKDSRINKSDVLSLISTHKDSYDETEKTSGIRKVIAKRMKYNWASTPMVTYNMEADMTELIELRNKLKTIYAKEGLKLTYNHIIIKILSKLLMKYKYLNASLEEDTIIYHKHVNIGIAVNVEKGLIVPNVKKTELKTLREIAAETENLIYKARNNSLNPDELTGGTFTITNMGMFGLESFTPIINKPEVAILGLNKIMDKPVAINKEVVIRPMMNLSLTTDHSLVDGVLSTNLLIEIKDRIENPYLLI